MQVKLDLHYTDARLVDLYDTDNPRGIDYDFYIQLAKDINASKILDLGCGTGLLTRELAGNGWNLTGVDPSAAMLAYAKKQANANLVQWIEGDSSVLGKANADLVLMTGNVAQVFLEDDYWLKTLGNIYNALKPGGYVAFESRNPAARAWENWNQVHFQGHNIFTETGETLVVDSILRFRTDQEICSSLEESGFKVKHVYGGWNYEPFSIESQLMIFVAQRPESSSSAK